MQASRSHRAARSPSRREHPEIATEIRSVSESARQAFDRGDVREAALLAEMVVDLAKNALDPRVAPTVERFAELLEKILVVRLGGISRLLRAVPSSPTLALLKLTPEEAFLLSRIDDGLTLEETLDVSAMPRLETLRLLTRLLRSGALTQTD